MTKPTEQPINLGRDFTEKASEIFNVPTGLEQPNPNLLIVKTIQQRMHVITNELDKLGHNIGTHYRRPNHRSKLIHKALEEIDLFEKTTLFNLQKAFE